VAKNVAVEDPDVQVAVDGKDVISRENWTEAVGLEDLVAVEKDLSARAGPGPGDLGVRARGF
jgi:hypothetical protein